jgi:hypothetical protein
VNRSSHPSARQTVIRSLAGLGSAVLVRFLQADLGHTVHVVRSL